MTKSLPDKKSKVGYSQDMEGIALAILTMGISLVLVIVLYLWIGHFGPTYSTTVMEKQQTVLRKQYGLPPQKPIPKNLLEVPPSLRNFTKLDSNNNNNNNNTTNEITMSLNRDAVVGLNDGASPLRSIYSGRKLD
jgi:hypothetical protein